MPEANGYRSSGTFGNKAVPMKPIHVLLSIGISLPALGQTNYNQITNILSPVDGITPVTVIANLAGICAVVRKDKESGKIIIAETLKNGASDKAGLIVNDEITQIDSTRTAGMELEAVGSLLRGDPGTIVKLKVVREGTPSPIPVDVTREVVILPKQE